MSLADEVSGADQSSPGGAPNENSPAAKGLTAPAAKGPTDPAAKGPTDPAAKAVNKPLLAVLVIAIVLTLDLATKWWVVQNMSLHQTISVFGDVVRLTYTHNPGAAFGINVGEQSRIFFLVLALIALGVLAAIYRSTSSTDRLRLLAVALVGAGAMGNIIDRFRFEAGVVDFLDIGIGAHRWWVFNVADSAVTVGAILLLISFLMEERSERAARKAAAGSAQPASGSGSGDTGRRAEAPGVGEP